MRTSGTLNPYPWFTDEESLPPNNASFIFQDEWPPPSGVSAMTTNNKLARARKHITTRRYGGGTSPQNLPRCRISPTKQRRQSKTATKTNSFKVKNRKKTELQARSSRELGRNTRRKFLGLDTSQSFRRTLDVTMDILDKPVALKTCGTNHDITGQSAKVKTTPGSAGPKRVVNLERKLCRQDRLCSSRRCARPIGIRQESSRTGRRKFWGRRWLNGSCTTLRDRSSCSGQRNRRKRHRWNNSSRPTRSKINRASPN